MTTPRSAWKGAWDGKSETVDDFEVGDVVQRALDRLTLPAEATTALSSTLDSHNGLSGCAGSSSRSRRTGPRWI